MPGYTAKTRAAYQHFLKRRKTLTLVFLSAWMPNPNTQNHNLFFDCCGS